jgi:hypothetical protein
MLLLVLMLQSVTQPPARISHVRMTARPISRPVRQLHLMPDCRLDASCKRTDPNRLIADTELREDPKQAALRGAWQNCGITGMSVCPSRGRQMLRANLGD